MSESVFPVAADVSSLVLDETSLAFFQNQTGIFDEEELRNHIITIASDALKSHPYPCFRSFRFVQSDIKRVPWFKHVVELGRSQPDALLLDVGCGLGDDLRRLAADGYPAKNMIGSDIVGGLWDIGHQLFRSNEHTFPARFIQDDVVSERYTSFPLKTDDKPSLADLSGSLSAIYASFFLHLFSHEQQKQVARVLASLLTQKSGCIIFGKHLTSETDSLMELKTPTGQFNMSCFSPAGWERIWKEEIFPGRKVEVQSMVDYLSSDEVSRIMSSPPGLSPSAVRYHWFVRLL